jgi:uncharacterized repeat protein (TIGR03833 family)
VTRITGLPSENLDAIASRLRKALGCGATVEGEDVVLQGALAERASEWLERAGDLRAMSDERSQPRQHGAPTAPRLQTDEPRLAGVQRADVRPGRLVAIVQKADQPTGKLTEGIVSEVLTSSPSHPHGIKVRLETGEVGRVKTVFR